MSTVFHPNLATIVPFNAEYQYPSQATQTKKSVVRFVPSGNVGDYYANQKISFVLPASGYLNPLNSAFSFTVTIPTDTVGTVTFTKHASAAKTYTAVAADLNTIFGGGFAVTDAFNGWTVQLSEVTATVVSSTLASGTMTFVVDEEDISTSASSAITGTISKGTRLGDAGVHELLEYVHIEYGGFPLERLDKYALYARAQINAGYSMDYRATVGNLLEGVKAPIIYDKDLEIGGTPKVYINHNQNDIPISGGRQYTFTIFAGIFNQPKLIPLQWMAGALKMDIGLRSNTEALIAPVSSSATYKVSNPVFIAEIIHFDSLYDTAFYDGMMQRGVPIKFESYQVHEHTIVSNGRENYQMNVNAKSIKKAFTIITDVNKAIAKDSNLFYHDVGRYLNANGSYVSASGDTHVPCRVRDYQWKIGSTYLPSLPVLCTGGATEAYFELAKAMNTHGDRNFAPYITLPEWTSETAGSRGGGKFMMAMEFELLDIFPNTIAGINGENQSSLQLMLTLGGGGGTVASGTKNVTTFFTYDALLIIKGKNMIELIQ